MLQFAMLILRSVTQMYMCDSEVSIHGIERKKGHLDASI